jgi:acyl-CoA synthetase (AMP-forming)/AMP-acid ligase II
MHGPLTVENSAAPILTALESYRGQVIDLDEDRTVSGAELRAGADAVATWLTRQGLEPADRVVFSVGNGPAFPSAFCGVLMAGGSPLLLHGEAPPDELRRFAQQYAARFIVTQRAEQDDLRYATWLNLSGVEVPLEPGAPPFPPLVSTPLHPTSGTTGYAKVAVRTAQQAVAEATHYIDTMRIDSDDCILCAVPMSHAYGFGIGLMVSLVSGATLLTMRQFNPRAVARALAGSDGRITVFPAVPAMLDLIVQAIDCEVAMPRLVLTAGAPLAEATAAAFRRRTGTRVTPLYGTTETGGISVAVGDSADPPTGCVGPPMKGVEARIVAIEGAAELAPGVGRVKIRSSSMMSGYLTPQGVDDSMLHDGWFETGDLGHIGVDGRIRLVGREKEIINVFGMKVVPSEVEEVISAIPGVREVKVYAGTHRSGSEIVKVALAANGAVDIATVRSHCETQLAPYKRPQLIHLVEALPRSPQGKILRDGLP